MSLEPGSLFLSILISVVGLGYSDASAFALLAYHRHDQTVYVLEVFKKTKMDVTDVAARNPGSFVDKLIHMDREAYDPGKGSKLDAATKKAWDLFKSEQPLPDVILTPPKG